MSNYPLYSVIYDNVEIGVAGSDEDAQEIADGFDIVLVNEKRPTNIEKLDVDANVKDEAYYVRADSEDFNNTELSKSLDKLVNLKTSFKNLKTKNSSEDFEEMSTWTLKELLLEAYKLNEK